MNAILKFPEKAEVIGIPNWDVVRCWGKLSELLKPVMEREEVDNTPDDVYQFLKSGNMQAWHINWETVFVTMVTPYGADQKNPTKKVCQLVYCAGKDLDKWLPFAKPFFMDWAKSMGCSCLRITGRDGWGKVLPDFKKTCTTFEIKV